MRWIRTAVAATVLAGLGLACSSSKDSSKAVHPTNAPAVADEKPLTPTVPGAGGGPGPKQRPVDKNPQ
jgi:hypothetical protein